MTTTYHSPINQRPMHIQVTCIGCGKTTDIQTDNAIGITGLKCTICGADGFRRKVM